LKPIGRGKAEWRSFLETIHGTKWSTTVSAQAGAQKEIPKDGGQPKGRYLIPTPIRENRGVQGWRLKTSWSPNLPIRRTVGGVLPEFYGGTENRLGSRKSGCSRTRIPRSTGKKKPLFKTEAVQLGLKPVDTGPERGHRRKKLYSKGPQGDFLGAKSQKKIHIGAGTGFFFFFRGGNSLVPGRSFQKCFPNYGLENREAWQKRVERGKGLTANPAKLKICFAFRKLRKSFVLPRQGGTIELAWPTTDPNSGIDWVLAAPM